MTQGLLLLAHGSRDARAAQVAQQVASAAATRARAATPDLESCAAFLELAAPSPEQALDLLGERGVDDVVVQPFLLSHAYHSKVDLPGVSALVEERGWPVRTGDVLGPDDLLIDALAARLDEACAAAGYDAVVLAAAGSTDPDANRAVQGVASALATRIDTPVTAGFASAAEPRVGPAVSQAKAGGARRVAVATYLLAPGFFADRIRADAGQAGAFEVSAPLGARPEIVELVLRRSGLA
ncbi:sirohydrochlorin chelatase [Actinopolymorpha sp. B11F2]|uniref:sirohydrochlorin chelatase n=1 Tax=Actinopolymorpha sp. B11F2 TaxID=3160862 RepID=UPI0032E49BBD